jgi:beta-lactamase regulating signal transducer with metallopeptidase domain
MFTVSVEVQSASPQSPQLTSPPSPPVNLIVLAVFAVLILVCLFVLIFVWRRRRRRPSSEPGACSYLKHRLKEVTNLYYYKIEEKQVENMVKTDLVN